MHTFSRILRAALFLVVVVNGGIALGSGEVRAESNAIPPNYRVLIARQMLKMDYWVKYLPTAMIAKPYNKPDGLSGRLTGTTVPVVCVSITTTNIFGNQSKGYLIFYFEDGELREWPRASGVLVSECGAFSPFTEVMKR